MTTPSGTATSLLLTVPARPRAPAARSAPRAWGLFAPLYALHDRQTWGCGDFSALERFVAWAADHGATVVGTLPILSAFLDRLYDPSPYRPVEPDLLERGLPGRDAGTGVRGVRTGPADRGVR